MRSPSLVGLYPRAWRDRYGDEMEALIEAAKLRRRDRIDLVRGALDAWLHPPSRSRAPIIAALIGGGVWTALAAGILVQPAPPDWPGYLLEIVPLAVIAAACLLVSAAGCALRAGEAKGQSIGLATGLVVVGHVAWIGMLGATILGVVGSPALAAAQTLAMVGTMAVGLVLVRARDERIGFLLIAAPVAMLVPSTVTWLAYGAAWTAIGIMTWLDRAGRNGSARITA